MQTPELRLICCALCGPWRSRAFNRKDRKGRKEQLGKIPSDCSAALYRKTVKLLAQLSQLFLFSLRPLRSLRLKAFDL